MPWIVAGVQSYLFGVLSLAGKEKVIRVGLARTVSVRSGPPTGNPARRLSRVMAPARRGGFSSSGPPRPPGWLVSVRAGWRAAGGVLCVPDL